jgi:ribosomal protein S18 acetylase RimI-like enzyme
LDDLLLSRVEDASLNASAPPQQRWLDGWLVRFSPGKAKRARCINAVASGRMPTAQKLALCEPIYREAGLPLVVRITRFSQPTSLESDLAALGLKVLDDTRVMVNQDLASDTTTTLPAGLHWTALDAAAFAEVVGQMRGTPAEQRQAHAQRIALSPVSYCGYAIQRESDGLVLACGQFAIEGQLVGLYDVFTRECERGRGLAQLLCQHLLSRAVKSGAGIAYLQVELANVVARRIYERLGFIEGYRYHYRQMLPTT